MTGTPNSAKTARQQEADLLADIGAALWSQTLRVHVTLALDGDVLAGLIPTQAGRTPGVEWGSVIGVCGA